MVIMNKKPKNKKEIIDIIEKYLMELFILFLKKYIKINIKNIK
jgi:hypothetical protein